MRLTFRSEYALLALAYLARSPEEEYVAVHAIADKQGIPRTFLEQILLRLKRSRLVQSTRGQNGGYRLARPAKTITLAEVIRLFDGHLAPTESVSKHFRKSTPIEKERKLFRIFTEIRDYVADAMEATTLADIR